MIAHLTSVGAATAVQVAIALSMSYGGALACLNRLTAAGTLTAIEPPIGERAKRWTLPTH